MSKGLNTILEELLKSKPQYVAEDGKILKPVVQADVSSMNIDLIKLLLSNEEVKSTFFVKAEGLLIFDKQKFSWFIESKEFLPDSFTKYSNKIGLLQGDRFVNQSNDVVLSFPYKDCVLVGGQSREDQKREEVFLNEVISSHEITRMLEPKVFTNPIRYTKGHSCSVTKIGEYENLVIKGNNLISIGSLLKKYEGQIKLIYIDPPYNTGGEANTFAYNNTFNHSTWLTFMKNRLEVAKQLLSKEGVICIAIDDEEYAHLKVLCDEIFDRENYVGTIVVQSNPRGRTINSNFATCHEYSLFYAKNIERITINNQELTDEQAGDFNKKDENGNYRLLPFRRSGGTSTPAERPNSEFTLYYSKEANNIIAVGGARTTSADEEYQPKEILVLDENNKVKGIDPQVFLDEHPDIVALLPIDILGKRRVWRWSDREAILNAAKNGDYVVNYEKGKYTVQLKDRIKEGRKPKTIWSDSRYDASANGTILLKKMFNGNKIFSYPKSFYTVYDIVKMLTDSDSGDIVLDFFGGSGTTAHAVLQLNSEDGGNRQFIICEQMDYIKNVTVERINKVLSDKDSFVYFELKENAYKLINYINSATEETIDDVKNTIYNDERIVSYIAKSDLLEAEEDFANLSLDEKKKALLGLVDKNKLYVNYSDVLDTTYGVSDAEKSFTKSFYEGE